MPIIVQLISDAWKLEIVGRLPQIPPFLSLTANTEIEVNGAGDLQTWNRSTNDLINTAPGEPIEPLFFENVNYDFYLEIKNGTTDLLLPPTGSLHHEFRNVKHYGINFRNDVGFSEMALRNEVTGVTIIRFEVFSIKIDYRFDYIQMRDEVASITRNLVMTVQARTFGAASAITIKQPTLVEWLSLARHYFKNLIAAANAIARNPHSSLIATTKTVPINRSRNVDTKGLARLLRRPVCRVGAILPSAGIRLPDRVPEMHRRLTFDTPANRYVKALLLETLRNLQRLIRTTSTGDEDADLTAEEKFFEAARPHAQAMLRQVQVVLRGAYLKEVTTTPPIRPTSMVLHHHPHYAAFVRTAQLLNGGLSLGGGPLQIGVKDIALLYEYWCFLKLTSLLSKQFDLEQQTFVRVTHTKITVTLGKGMESAIRYRDRSTGKELLLIYNRLFNRLPTIAQRPDNVIQFLSDENLYIFDAKYRLSFNDKYQKQFGGIGPTVDDISTMHRYRDAIVIPHVASKGKYITRVVRGACVLFPFRDEDEYRKHNFFQSLSSVEIGGLPFLPEATDLVVAKLSNLLSTKGDTTLDEPGSQASP